MPRYIDHRPLNERLQVRRYDRAASLLITLLILVGIADQLLFLMWFQPAPLTLQPVAQPRVEWTQAATSPYLGQTVPAIDPPGTDELDEFMEPSTESLLESVTEVVTTTAAAWDTQSLPVDSSRGLRGDGIRRIGPPVIGPPIVPEWDRWRIHYVTSSLDVYAAQLDAFGIELAAIGGGVPLIDYARHFSTNVVTRRGRGSQEDRVYFVHANGQVRTYDARLLRRAGIETQGRVVAQFIPHQLREQLLALELRYAKSQSSAARLPSEQQTEILKMVAQTVFGVRLKNGRYEFYVVSQSYRQTPVQGQHPG